MRILTSLLSLCMLANVAQAQGLIAAIQPTQPAEQRKPPALRVVKMSVRPAAPPRPAMKYTLLPTSIERTPGDAATLWLLAVDMVRSQEAQQEQITRFLDQPLDQLDTAAARRSLGQPAQTDAPGGELGHLRFAAQAARRQTCNWELTLRSEGFFALLPHLNGMRSLSRTVALKARADLKDGRIDSAIESLKTGYAMAHHLNDDAVLIQVLVGAAIAQSMSRQVEQLISDDRAPNLYWALAYLPRPFVDVRLAFESELVGVLATLPQLREARDGKLSAEEFSRAIDQLPSLMAMAGSTGGNASSSRIGLALMMARLYPEAKAYVIGLKERTAAEVEAMPVHQVLATYLLGTYEEWWSELNKWTALPYWQARPGLAQASRKLQAMRNTMSPLLAFVPAVEAAYGRLMLVDRQIASLQCIEAIRAYAAEHDGALPAKLEDITATPAPIDPATGAMFPYSVKDNTAILDAPAPAGERADLGWRYEITIRK